MKTITKQFSALVTATIVSVVFSLGVTAPVQAQDQAKSLDELLSLVRKGKIRESREDRQRAARFLADKKQQAGEVTKAKQTRTQEEKRSARLEKYFEVNKEKIAAKREALKQAKGELPSSSAISTQPLVICAKTLRLR